MIPDRQKRPVTVEDLLKVKRGERPDGEFWDSWQASMRGRLAEARTVRRPWYKDALHRFFIGVARNQIALGTTCVVMLGIAVVHESNVSFAPLPGTLPSSAPTVQQELLRPVLTESTDALLTSDAQDIRDLEPLSSELPQTRTATHAITRIESGLKDSPAAKAIAANLAAVRAEDSSLSPRFNFGEVFQIPVSSPEVVESTQEPVANTLGYTYSSNSSEIIPHSRRQDRLLSRLSEEALSETQARRLGGSRGDRLSLRF